MGTCGGTVDYLFGLLVDTLPRFLARRTDGALHVTGNRALIPSRRVMRWNTRSARRQRDRSTSLLRRRSDIALAVRRALLDSDGAPTEHDITAGFGGGPVKEIDLVIRTGDEQRLSGFFPWQTARAELNFSRKHWPAFNARDFERALTYFASKRS